MMIKNRVHVLGASGSGATTLGGALAHSLGVPHLDTDDYYWLPGDPPFTDKREPGERVRLIEQGIADAPGWVLSGSLCSWGDPLLHRFTLAVFLHLAPEQRLARLAARERQRYGERIDLGGDLYEKHRAFMAWAAEYDAGKAPLRSLHMHETWLEGLACPVLRLDSVRPVGALVAAVQAAVTLESASPPCDAANPAVKGTHR